MPDEPETRPVAALILRGIIALAAVGTYALVRDDLGPGALVAARFGLGVLLFTLLVDVGRSIAGTGPAIRGNLAPHEQRARSQVDETYDRLRQALRRYVSDGDLTSPLVEQIRKAAEARDLGEEATRDLVEGVRSAASRERTRHRPLAVRLLAGGVVAVGLGLGAAMIAESLGMPLVPPILLVSGTSIATLQWRAQASGARWTGLVLGLLGGVLFGLGSLRLVLLQPSVGVPLLVVAGLVLVGTLVATWRVDRKPDPWRIVEPDLETSMDGLRRAFLVTLVAGVVVFPLEPLLASILSAFQLPRELALRTALVGFITVTAFLTLEMTGTWLALTRGRRRAEGRQENRRDAVEAVLEKLEREDEAIEMERRQPA